MPDRTPAELLTAAADKLEQVLRAATELPWAAWHDLDHQGFITIGNEAGAIPEGGTQSPGEAIPTTQVYVEPDAQLIVALVNAAPQILATLRAAAEVYRAVPLTEGPDLDLARAILRATGGAK